jgi:acetyl-CoA C-acetyltransferase
MTKDIFILEGARTPFGTWGGGTRADGQKGGLLKPFDAFDLAAAALKESMRRNQVDPASLDKVVMANTYHVGPHACYGARYVSVRAGVPVEVPNLTVNLACGSGLQTIISSVQEIQLGEADLVAATGADSSSNVPRNVFVPSFKDALCNEQIAQTSQIMSRELGITRAEQDRWSLISHQRAADAKKKGFLQEDIVKVGDLDFDDALLENPTPEHFAASKLLFETGDATPANTHAVVDGGSAVLVASSKKAKGNVLGRYVSGAVVSVAPEKMARASVVAVDKLLAKSGFKKQEVDLFELNETFASQLLIDLKETGIPEEKVNVNGGAIAIGHPFGATGPRIVQTLLKELKRRGKKRGIAAICVGAGSGIAVLVETV